MLTEAPKYGLHLILIHHEPDQIKSIAGAMHSAQTKITFRQEDSAKESRWFTLRRPNHETIEAKTPDIPEFQVCGQELEQYVEELTQDFLPIEAVDRLLDSPSNDKEDKSGELDFGDLLR